MTLLISNKISQIFDHFRGFFANWSNPLLREGEAILRVDSLSIKPKFGGWKQKLTVPVSRRWAAKEYLTPIFLYTQSTMFPGALERSIGVRMVPWRLERFVELTYITSNTALPSGISSVTNQHSRTERRRQMAYGEMHAMQFLHCKGGPGNGLHLILGVFWTSPA